MTLPDQIWTPIVSPIDPTNEKDLLKSVLDSMQGSYTFDVFHSKGRRKIRYTHNRDGAVAHRVVKLQSGAVAIERPSNDLNKRRSKEIYLASLPVNL